MEPAAIFELIVKADEKLKYATAARGDQRARQAADLLDEAIREAEAIGNDALVQQAKVRVADLEALMASGEASGSAAENAGESEPGHGSD